MTKVACLISLFLLIFCKINVESSTCDIATSDRVPCLSWLDWDLSEKYCLERGCCWDPNPLSLYEENYCYYNNPKTDITTVHVVHGCHLDVGFANTSVDIVNLWFDKYFPLAHKVGRALESWTNTTARLKFTAQSWLISLYIDCPSHWEGIHCPSQTALKDFYESVEKEWITWHAFPFNSELDFTNADLIKFGVRLTHDLDAKFGKPPKKTISQRDVPGMTRSAIPILLSANITAISIGANGGSTPANVPKAFIWHDPVSGKSIPTFYLEGGYSGIAPFTPLSPLPSGFAYTTIPGSSQALVVDWRGDNAGPAPSPQYLADHFATIQKEFPSAKVIPSTFDNFVSSLNLDLLPVLSAEMADTWIHGVGSDPIKTAKVRNMLRLNSECIKEGKCSFDDSRFYKYNRFFIKNSEHTWGLDVKTVLAPPDFQRNNWGNSEFQKVRSDVRFQNLEASWIRQRRWGIDDAITELGNHSLVTQIHQMFEELKASIPSTDGFRYVSPSSPALNFDCGRFKIAFNETTGAISSLKDSKTDIDWVSNDDLLLLEYRTYDANDYSNFMLNYNYMGWFYYFDDLDDFDKVGINLYNAKRRIIHPKLDQFWVKNLTDNSNVKDNLIGTQFLLRLVFPQELIEVAGAPQFVWISLVVPSVDSTLNLTLQVFNKTTTRLPETMYFRFKPNASSSSLQFINTTWVMEKLGQPVDPSIVVTGGAKHVHYVSDGGMTYFAQTKASFSSSQIATSPKTNYSFQIKSSETGLICFGEPNAFPVPTNLNPNFHEGASFILWNNLWNTNYIMYFPFLAEEASIKYRFQLQFN